MWRFFVHRAVDCAAGDRLSCGLYAQRTGRCLSVSQSLGQLSAGQALDIALTIQELNRAQTEDFAHSVAFWLSPSPTGPPSSNTATQLAFSWSSGQQWVLGYRMPAAAATDTSTRPTIVLGAQRSIRITRGSDGAAQLWLDGANVLSIPDSDGVATVFAEVVGTRADFAF